MRCECGEKSDEDYVERQKSIEGLVIHVTPPQVQKLPLCLAMYLIEKGIDCFEIATQSVSATYTARETARFVIMLMG